MIDSAAKPKLPMRELMLELMEFIDDVVDDLGSRSAVEYIHTILNEGTSAERQLARVPADRRPERRGAPLVMETRASVQDARSNSAAAIN